MNRNEQVVLGRKIRKLIEKNVNSGFSSRFQGAGKVATLVISTSSKSFVGKIKFYLKNELQLDLHNGSKNHGSGEKNTIQVALSTIDPKSIELIEKQFKIILESSKKNNPPKKLEQKGDQVINTLKGPKLRVMNFSPSTKFIRKISPFLNGVFKFESAYLKESENLFEFNKSETDENYLTIHCLNEEVAQMVELATRWFSGNADLVIREGIDLIINFSDINKEKEPSWVGFCLPPKTNVSVDEIVNRLKRVRTGSNPKVTAVSLSSFCVNYVRADVVPKIYADLEKMGWTVVSKDKNSFIVECRDDYPGLKDIVPPKSFDSSKNTPENKTKDTLVKSIASNGFSSEETEAIQKLKDLRANQSLFDLLSLETKDEIAHLLEEIRQKEEKQKVETYARSLLAVLRK